MGLQSTGIDYFVDGEQGRGSNKSIHAEKQKKDRVLARNRPIVRQNTFTEDWVVWGIYWRGLCKGSVLIWYCSIPISIYIPVLAQIRKGLSKQSKYIEKYLQHDREGIVIRWRYNTARAAHVGGRSVNRDSCARLRGVCPRRNEEICFVWY